MSKQIQHRSMRGKIIDMDLLRKKNELTPAIGNARVNARGDELGPGGKIVRKREDIVREYYEKNPNAVRDETGYFAERREEVRLKENSESAKDASTKTTQRKPRSTTKDTAKEKKETWVEDSDGNFTRGE